jgi:hypothetical protein
LELEVVCGPKGDKLNPPDAKRNSRRFILSHRKRF